MDEKRESRAKMKSGKNRYLKRTREGHDGLQGLLETLVKFDGNPPHVDVPSY